MRERPIEPPETRNTPVATSQIAETFWGMREQRAFKAATKQAAAADVRTTSLHKGSSKTFLSAGLNRPKADWTLGEGREDGRPRFDQAQEASEKIELAGKLDNNLNVHIEKVAWMSR